MKTFLLTWNPEKWPWDDLADSIARVHAGEEVADQWTMVRKEAMQGDQVFLLKQGKEPRGIMGSGKVTGSTEIGPHYNRERAQKGDTRRYVPFVFETLVAPDELLPIAKIQEISGGPNNFQPQGSGCLLTEDVARQVEKLWSEHLRGLTGDLEKYAYEGQQRRAFVIHRHRETKLRDEKIRQTLQQNGGKLCCQVPGCDFDFSVIYGAVGEGYAQVHHLKPLAEIEGKRKSTLNDLIVVCANCHAMIHRNSKCRKPETLIKQNRKVARPFRASPLFNLLLRRNLLARDTNQRT